MLREQMSWHRPWEQAWVRVSHLMPQPPQFSSSVRMFVQDPSQHSWFALHCHSQLPQWLRLLFVSTQKLLQAIMPSSSRQHPSIVQTSSPGAWQHPFGSSGQGGSPGQHRSGPTHPSRHSRMPRGHRQAHASASNSLPPLHCWRVHSHLQVRLLR
jgi:hypothetical protein